MGTISINGRSYSGNNVSISNGVVTIDGQVQLDGAKLPTITINVQGNLDSLKVDSCREVDVTGDVNNLQTMSGDVRVSGSVFGRVETLSGNVKAGSIAGNVKTLSGNIKKG